MFLSLCYVVLRRVLQLAALRFRSTDLKELEIVVLRKELGILRRRTRRPPMIWTDRLFLASASQLFPRVRWRSFRAPQANGVAERFVRTVRSERLDWLLILNADYLERVLDVFVEHYNGHRPHRALALTPPRPARAAGGAGDGTGRGSCPASGSSRWRGSRVRPGDVTKFSAFCTLQPMQR